MSRTQKALDAPTVTRLLKQYLPLLRGAQKRHPWLDQHELRAVWEDAVCEAFCSHDAGRSQESGWIQRVFLWRLTALIERESVANTSLGTDPRILNGVSPEKSFWESAVMAEVLKLPPREQIILIAWANGYTYAEVASQVGVNVQRAHREAKKAIAEIRERFGLHGKDDRS